MFYNCDKLDKLDLSSFDTKNVINMSYMFYNCDKLDKLDKLDLSSFDTKNFVNKTQMFGGFFDSNNYKILQKNVDKYKYKFDYFFRISTIGNGYSCKIELIDQALYGKSVHENYPPIGLVTYNLFIEKEDSIIKLGIFHTPEKETYKQTREIAYRQSSLLLFVYKINSIDSFESIDFYIDEYKSFSLQDVKLFLVGNKLNIDENE